MPCCKRDVCFLGRRRRLLEFSIFYKNLDSTYCTEKHYKNNIKTGSSLHFHVALNPINVLGHIGVHSGNTLPGTQFRPEADNAVQDPPGPDSLHQRSTRVPSAGIFAFLTTGAKLPVTDYNSSWFVHRTAAVWFGYFKNHL